MVDVEQAKATQEKLFAAARRLSGSGKGGGAVRELIEAAAEQADLVAELCEEIARLEQASTPEAETLVNGARVSDARFESAIADLRR